MATRLQWCPRCKNLEEQVAGERIDVDATAYGRTFSRMYYKLSGKRGSERQEYLTAFFDEFFPDMPRMRGYLRNRECLGCGEQWLSVEAPDDFFGILHQEISRLWESERSLKLEAIDLRRRLDEFTDVVEKTKAILNEVPATTDR